MTSDVIAKRSLQALVLLGVRGHAPPGKFWKSQQAHDNRSQFELSTCSSSGKKKLSLNLAISKNTSLTSRGHRSLDNAPSQQITHPIKFAGFCVGTGLLAFRSKKWLQDVEGPCGSFRKFSLKIATTAHASIAIVIARMHKACDGTKSATSLSCISPLNDKCERKKKLRKSNKSTTICSTESQLSQYRVVPTTFTCVYH